MSGRRPRSASPGPHDANPVGSRRRHFLVAQDTALSPLSAGPLEFDWIVEQLRNDPDVVVDHELRPRSFALANAGPTITREIVAASMPETVRDQLAGHPQLIVEEDHAILPQETTTVAPPTVDPLLVRPFGVATTWELMISDPDGAPVVEATVFLYGSGMPAQGRTDAAGEVSLTLQNDSDDTLRALYVNPLRDLWSLWIDRPTLISGRPNSIVIQPLSTSFDGFPGRQLLGWGQSEMRLGDVPPEFDGRGVRVAVIDSGAASTTHADLASIVSGVDFTGAAPDPDQWRVDTIAHGSHCSGIIACGDDGRGIRGFAPAAEVDELRIFPGGRVSSLLDAVDYCIAEQMDVVNMSLGTGGTSQILLEKLAQAREQGVACIVAAGNSGGDVQFPGVSPDVLTVAAIGKDGTFPDGSYHAQQRWKGGAADGGVFSAQFSCHGPEVDVCAPGVAIVSSVPDNGYAAWDGTSMATPHVTGLAALLLAHHPDLQTPALRERTAARVDRLFEILRDSARPLSFGDPGRAGAGMPDAARALGIRADVAGSKDAEPSASADVAATRLSLLQLRRDLTAVGLLPEEMAPVREEEGAADGATIKRLLMGLRSALVEADLVPQP